MFFSGESVRGPEPRGVQGLHRFSRSPRPAAIENLEKLRAFDLSREVPGANQKQIPLCDLGGSAVNTISSMLLLIR
jgi:hypothetical protein